MEIAEIRKKVRKGEGQFLEFKRKSNNIEKLVKELIGFANSGGGTMLIGVSDTGNIRGLKDSVDDEYMIRQALRKHAVPRLPVTINHVKVNSSKSMLAIEVNNSSKKPHFFREKPGLKGKAFVRVADECVEASDELSSFLLQKRKSKGSLIKIRESERIVLKQLAVKENQTFSELVENCRMNRKKISDAVVRLAVINVLEIEPRPGKEDIIHFID